MRRALRLAEKGKGFVLPNPMVGAVLVKDGERIGDGYHKQFGEAHAEVNAIQNASEATEGATLYVTLEPCSHHGKTPPCVDAIIEAGISKVVIAAKDPSRNGIEVLEAAGIEVETGLLKDEAKKLNRAFHCFHEKKRPFVRLKAALSLDGKISAKTGEQTKITHDLARKLTHVMRHEHHAILVGAGTVLTDNPYLGVREIEGRDPLRLIWKGERELPLSLQVFRDENHQVIEAKTVKKLLEKAYELGVQSILVEGGSFVHTQFLESGLWDAMELFYGPSLLGDDGVPFYKAQESHSLRIGNVRQCGPDILLSVTPPWDLDPS